jgi:hypothetical protein
MKRNFLLLFLFAIAIVSCSKKDTDITNNPPPEEKDPLQIEKVIMRAYSQIDEQVITDTLFYEYDDSGRVTKRRQANAGLTEKYTYTNGKLSAITDNGTSTLNFSRYSDDGDTILLDFTRPAPGGVGHDTVQLTYVYKNEYVTEYWSHAHFYQSDLSSFQKVQYNYNNDGNITGSTIETFDDPHSTSSYTVYEWDDKVNPKHGQPKLNHLFLQSGLPMESFSVHNPIKYEDNVGITHNIKMTYNDEGYPLTVKVDDLDYISTEIFYNR